jgi:hypothetical protein
LSPGRDLGDTRTHKPTADDADAVNAFTHASGNVRPNEASERLPRPETYGWSP